MYLGQRHDVRGIDQQHAIGQLDVAKALFELGVVAQAIVAGGADDDDLTGTAASA